MFLHRVGMQKLKKFSKNGLLSGTSKPFLAKTTEGQLGSIDNKLTIRAFGALANLTETIYLNNGDSGTRVDFDLASHSLTIQF